MCGILGVAGPAGPAVAPRALDTLAHRGPDAADVAAAPDLTLGHRRLAIIGLDDGGRQPMPSASGDSLIVFNGEIYNYLEIADELEAAGEQVDRRYDTAVLLSALEVWGTEALARLNGMFAFAWFRRAQGRVLLARDRWGKKPLFWGRLDVGEGRRRLAFASELRTLMQLDRGGASVDALGVARYLVYDGLAGRRTIHRGIEKLAPGTWLDLDLDGEIRDRGRYVRFEPKPTRMSAEDATDALRERLDSAFALRLRSDVPVGLFLSGGIDSSLLAATWRTLRPNDTIRTFTVGFEEASFDERDSARIMAEAIDAEHREVVATGQDLVAALDDVWARLSEPFADPSIVPTSMVCRFAREHVVVALGGDGADEFQAGYDPFRAWSVARAMERMMPRRVWQQVLSRLERVLPASPENNALRFRVRHFAQGFAHPPDERIQGWMASLPLALALSVMKPELAAEVDVEAVLAPSRRAFREARQHGELYGEIATWVATYLESSILTKIDRASMLHSLEVRSPFLDPAVTDLFARLEPSLIFRRGRGKQLLRRLAASRLPRTLLQKPKKGLGVPQATWLRTVLRERVEAALEHNRQSGWFDHEAMLPMWRAHLSGRADYRKALWNFVFAAPFQ